MSYTLLRVQHTSLQFSDPRKQQEKDVRTLFAKGIAHPIKTGTEAGPSTPDKNANRQLLLHFAREYNHEICFGADNWIAVDRSIIVPGTVVKGDVFIVDNQKMRGNGHDRRMATFEFDHVDPRIGGLGFAAIHGALQGSKPGQVNTWINREIAEAIAAWMRRAGRGTDLAFVHGDFNINDKLHDWAFGRDFTSMADLLKTHPGTGHGPIDGFAKYDRDARVKARQFKVLGDRDLFMHSDHKVVRGVWEIGHLTPQQIARSKR